MDYIQDRKLKILLLSEARHRVEHDNFMICLAIASAAEMGTLVAAYPVKQIFLAENEMRIYIMDAIAPAIHYYEWICLNHPELRQPDVKVKVQEGRLAWIDWMIACYEEDIDNYKKEHHG